MIVESCAQVPFLDSGGSSYKLGVVTVIDAGIFERGNEESDMRQTDPNSQG